jgi:glycosyltransferase involved in cell wall biosynthesis
VAAGLGRALAERGYGVAFADPSQWSRPPAADLVVALLPAFDPACVPAGTPVVAWVRNETDRWAGLGRLSLYDAVLASSQLAGERLAEVYNGPMGVLPIGVDTALFRPASVRRGLDAVTTVNHWGTDRDVHRALRGLPEAARVRWYGEGRGIDQAMRCWHAGRVGYFALPDLYRRSLIVIDDMNSTTLPYGSLNSRLYESLACDAMPVANGGLGLAEVGLEEVPVYRTAADLDRILRELRADPDATTRKAKRLGAKVRAEHSWQRRTDAFLEHVTPLLERARGHQPTPRRATIGFFPDYRIANPYQDMLYEDIAAREVTVVPVDIRARVAPRDAGGPLDGYVLHVHWTSPLLQSLPGPFSAELALRRFKERVEDLLARGGRLVWTIHNVLPHECANRAAEIALRQFLADRADLIHVMGEDTAQIVAPLYKLPTDRVVVIPHSTYLGIYPDFVGREEARRRLGLREHEIALLALGGIRPYKGMGRLLDVFDAMSREDPRLRLLVAGKPGDFPDREKWQRRCERHPRIVAHFDFVADSDLQVWYRAADLAVLPYAAILNSGSFHLALAFGLPVVGPADGSLAALLDPAYSEPFRADSSQDLRRALDTAITRLVGRPDVGLAASSAARAYPPEAMARDFADAVLPLLATRSDPR